MKKALKNWKDAFLKLFTIRDSPQRIALGAGAGVFLGILPGTGPVAALALSFILPVNRLAILAGVVLTNTWLSIATFFLSIKIGSAIMKLNWEEVAQEWMLFLRDFNWAALGKISWAKIFFPVAVGFLLVGLMAGIAVYLAILTVFRLRALTICQKKEHS